MNIFWFRRDLRFEDNVGFFQALTAGEAAIPLFIFDKNILDFLPKQDKRLAFIHQCLENLQQKCVEMGSTLVVRYGKPMEIWQQLLMEFPISTVFTNHDYEPYAKERDAEIKALLLSKGIDFQSFKDQVIFEKSEVLSNAGTPYTVFTPYSRKWKERLTNFPISTFASEKQLDKCWKNAPLTIPSLAEMGFENIPAPLTSQEVNEAILQTYNNTRDFPANPKSTSRLGVHLRFGTISIRALAQKAQKINETYLNELIWREFYMQILWHFPKVVGNAFKAEYDRIEWQNDEKLFEKWKQGKTGFPLVDAGMRELNATGYMHNRVRMLVASFLTKHLLIDWRWGEAYFAEKLLDFELASNNGGWQWAAGTGCDAAPYFRVFSPDAQLAKFDKEMVYVRRWVKEFGTTLYPKPIINHAFARERVLAVYKKALEK
jgi:deoxyribodipyrimidine photo-lyase